MGPSPPDKPPIQGIDGIRRIRSVRWIHEVTPQLLPDSANSATSAATCTSPRKAAATRSPRLMGRKYTAGQYEEMVARAREKTLGLAISTDIIVGFPGEEEEDFLATLTFVRRMHFSRLQVFTYSRAKHTRARLQDLPKKVKEERSQRLIQLGDERKLAFHQQLVGRVEEVLLEAPGQRAGLVGGTDGQLWRVVAAGLDELVGSLPPVRITAPIRTMWMANCF